MYFRRGRYYLGRNQQAAGSTLDDALATLNLYGIAPESSNLQAPPAGYARRLLYRARVNARAKGVPCELTIDDVLVMLTDAGPTCPICGVRFDYWDTRGGKRFRPWVPSIDRVDPAKGYIRSNCRIVSAYVNLAMNEFGEEVFQTIARYVATARNRKNCGMPAKPRRITGRVGTRQKSQTIE